MNILVFCDCYLPGYKAGGPVRSLANLVEHLGKELHFYIVTRDRDFGNHRPYPGINVNSWQRVGNADVCYLSPNKITLKFFTKVFCTTPHDLVYLNSFFSPSFSIKPLLLRWVGRGQNIPFLIAPRGEFSTGALNIKRFKKRLFLFMTKILGLYNNLLWHATSQREQNDIIRENGKSLRIFRADNLSIQCKQIENLCPFKDKQIGKLRVVFLSRISENKNLDGALKILKSIKAQIEFNIYGPMENLDYWKMCNTLINETPNNISVVYHGDVPHEEVNTKLSGNHLFFLPTKGENYGHVIMEALQAGCPILISDLTPWRELEEKAVGWDIPLTKPDRFQEVLEMCAAMDETQFRQFSINAQTYASQCMEDNNAVAACREMFSQAILKKDKKKV